MEEDLKKCYENTIKILSERNDKDKKAIQSLETMFYICLFLLMVAAFILVSLLINIS